MNEKEKFEEAKRLYQTANADQRYVIETLFPELKESEDERIRKELIKHLREGAEGYEPTGNTEDYTRWLSWVEKQKEYESTDFEYVWDRTDCGDLTSALDKYSEEAIINMCHAWYDKGIELERKSWLEKQGEHSIYNVPSREVILAIWDLGNEWKELTNGCISTEYDTQLDYIQKHWNESEYYLREKQDEQKPQRMVSAEAKEALYDKPTDEEMKELLRTEYEKGRADTIAETKLSWSEEDEKILNNLIDYIKVDDALQYSEKQVVDWLKSLRPQNRWKPSDEQMDALNDVISSRDIKYDVLSELWKDLAKL